MSALAHIVRPAAIIVAGGGLLLTGTACSSGDADQAPTSSSERTVMTCAQYRSLDDPARVETVRELGVTANVEQVATVAATVCLGRSDDAISVVIDELVPER